MSNWQSYLIDSLNLSYKNIYDIPWVYTILILATQTLIHRTWLKAWGYCFRMMTNAEYHEEEISKRKQKQESKDSNLIKGQKLLTLSSKIAEHDLMTRIRKIGKLLDKQYEVKVVISGEDNEDNPKYVSKFTVFQ